ncbi:hypothetical protein CEW92_14930 [Bacillaceae bacterium SAS-127]|nr:hypothetical protein CEW92_14930 [Bacillaceae bacterium SAS-127]
MALGAGQHRKAEPTALGRQAKDESAERLFFNLLDGLAFDLKRLVSGARHHEKQKALFSGV